MNRTLGDIIDLQSTITAISTPPGKGGIAVVRLSGPDAIKIADKIWSGKSLLSAASHTAHFGIVLDRTQKPLDECVATVFRAPKSFTGQDTVEFSVHGSKYVQREIIDTLTLNGARIAMPGEFTRRAFANGNLKLTQAEAIADIIASESRAAHRLAIDQLKGSVSDTIERLRNQLIDFLSLLELELDFSEEEVEFADRSKLRSYANLIIKHIDKLLNTFATGNAIKNGIPVAIVGPTNAGKSSLLNALVDNDRAIVSDIHGTTRDTVEETAEIGDYLFRFIDTAGLRATDDPIENLGIARSRKAAEKAHIILNIIDLTNPSEGEKYAEDIARELHPHQTQIRIYNKADLSTPSEPEQQNAITISAKTSEGIDRLRDRLLQIFDRQKDQNSDEGQSGDTQQSVLLTNQRHAEALKRASESAHAMLNALDSDLPTELIAEEARETIAALSELTGQITTPDILSTVFSRFCIGK